MRGCESQGRLHFTHALTEGKGERVVRGGEERV